MSPEQISESAIYDISSTIDESLAVWPGDRKFQSRRSMEIGKGDSCNLSSVTLSVHAGTHIDAPFHFDDSGPGAAEVPLEHCIGPVRVVPVAREGAIAASDLKGLDLAGVRRILFKTKASEQPESRFSRGFPYLSEEAAEFLGRMALKLVGTDSPSVEEYSSRDLRCHRILGRYGVTILEGVRLGGVPPGDYELICFPLKLARLDGSPVRAVLRTLRG